MMQACGPVVRPHEILQTLIISIPQPSPAVKSFFGQKVILSYTTDLLRCVAQFFYAGKEVNALADYAFRSYEERQKIQEMVEAGLSAKDIAASLGISPSAVYAELRRGRDGTRLPDKRLGYNAELAQLSVQQGLERRGRRTAGA